MKSKLVSSRHRGPPGMEDYGNAANVLKTSVAVLRDEKG